MAYNFISGEDREVLEAILDDLEFVPPIDLAKYKCVNCKKLTLCHFVPSCHHIYCRKCHRIMHQKPCLFRGCSTIVYELQQDESMIVYMANLEVFCPFRSMGCKEIKPLSSYLGHKKECTYDPKKALPKLLKTNELTAYKEMNDEEIFALKTTISHLTKSLEMLKAQVKSQETQIVAYQSQEIPKQIEAEVKRRSKEFQESMLEELGKKFLLQGNNRDLTPLPASGNGTRPIPMPTPHSSYNYHPMPDPSRAYYTGSSTDNTILLNVRGPAKINDATPYPAFYTGPNNPYPSNPCKY